MDADDVRPLVGALWSRLRVVGAHEPGAWLEMQIDLWRDLPAPSEALHVCVVVPVRNEAAVLHRSLVALAAQVGVSGQPLERRHYELLLLANNCQDASADIARGFARQHADLALHVAEVELPPQQANIGHVRRLLMDRAAVRLGAAGIRGVIASTDGDTVVASDWLACILRNIDAGADAVGGRIAIDASDDTDPRLRRWRRCDTAYRLASERLASLLDPEPADPWPRHHQHFCGSLAITRAAYLQVGGLPDVTYLEDEALVAALRRHDLQLRHSPEVRVTTSGRQVGRAEVGLAWQLRQWADGGAGAHGLSVEDAGALANRYSARRQLRGLWQSRHLPAAGDQLRAEHLSSRWGMTGHELMVRVLAAPTFGGVWEALEAARHSRDRQVLVPLPQALAGLRAMNRELRGRHDA